MRKAKRFGLLVGIICVGIILLVFNLRPADNPEQPTRLLKVNSSRPSESAFVDFTFRILDSTEWVDTNLIFVGLHDSSNYYIQERISMFEPEGQPYLEATIVHLSKNLLTYRLKLDLSEFNPTSDRLELIPEPDRNTRPFCATITLENHRAKVLAVNPCEN